MWDNETRRLQSLVMTDGLQSKIGSERSLVTNRLRSLARPNRGTQAAPSVVMRPGWHHLLFLHWEVAPEALRALLPPGLELDLYEERAYVGLIPFTMTDVRPRHLPPLPLPRRLYQDFHETNVRTYVRVNGGEPGVWFFSLDAASRLAVLAARAWFRLPYFHARMRLRHRHQSDGRETAEYFSRRVWPGPKPAKCAVKCAPHGVVRAALPDTLEHFLVERYLLYSRVGKTLYRGRVCHKPYRLQAAQVLSLEENLVAAAGIARPDAPPLAHYARSVSVEIFALEKVK